MLRELNGNDDRYINPQSTLLINLIITALFPDDLTPGYVANGRTPRITRALVVGLGDEDAGKSSRERPCLSC